jgi:hypothetical protein
MDFIWLNLFEVTGDLDFMDLRKAAGFGPLGILLEEPMSDMPVEDLAIRV